MNTMVGNSWFFTEFFKIWKRPYEQCILSENYPTYQNLKQLFGIIGNNFRLANKKWTSVELTFTRRLIYHCIRMTHAVIKTRLSIPRDYVAGRFETDDERRCEVFLFLKSPVESLLNGFMDDPSSNQEIYTHLTHVLWEKWNKEDPFPIWPPDDELIKIEHLNTVVVVMLELSRTSFVVAMREKRARTVHLARLARITMNKQLPLKTKTEQSSLGSKNNPIPIDDYLVTVEEVKSNQDFDHCGSEETDDPVDVGSPRIAWVDEPVFDVEGLFAELPVGNTNNDNEVIRFICENRDTNGKKRAFCPLYSVKDLEKGLPFVEGNDKLHDKWSTTGNKNDLAVEELLKLIMGGKFESTEVNSFNPLTWIIGIPFRCVHLDDNWWKKDFLILWEVVLVTASKPKKVEHKAYVVLNPKTGFIFPHGDGKKMGAFLSDINRLNAANASENTSFDSFWRVEEEPVSEKPYCRKIKDNLCNFVFPGVVKKSGLYGSHDLDLSFTYTKMIYGSNAKHVPLKKFG